eukprot:15046862-Ditylum_brightwellii.AAC.1
MSQDLSEEWLYINFAHRLPSFYADVMNKRNINCEFDGPEGSSTCTMEWSPEVVVCGPLINFKGKPRFFDPKNVTKSVKYIGDINNKYILIASMKNS